MGLSATYTKVETDYLLQKLESELSSGLIGSLKITDTCCSKYSWNIEGNVSLFQEYFEQQERELNFTPIQIVAVYQDGIRLSNSEYEIILPKKNKNKRVCRWKHTSTIYKIKNLKIWDYQQLIQK